MTEFRHPLRGAALLSIAILAGGTLLHAETFTFSGNQMETVLARGRERTVLTGDAELISEDTYISADRIELFGDDFAFAVSTGNIRLINTDDGLELTSDEMFYDRINGIARIQGNAIMVDRSNEIVVKGEFIENWEDRDETVIQIGVRILKTDLVARAEFARYRRDANTLELSGLPVVTWKGDEYRASRIFIDLDADSIVLDGGVQGAVTSGEPDPTPASGTPVESPSGSTGSPRGQREPIGSTTDGATPDSRTTGAAAETTGASQTPKPPPESGANDAMGGSP